MLRVRPEKPYADYPLTPHSAGVWCKKIRGKVHYFGPWDDWQGALNEFLAQRDDLYAGRNPNRVKGGVTLGHALNHFLSSKKTALESGEITPRTYWELDRTCERIAKSIGTRTLLSEVGPADLDALRLELGNGYKKDTASKIKIKARVSPTTVKGELTRARMFFLYCNEYLAEKPIVYRKPLRSPSRRDLRRVVNERGPRDFTAKQIKALAKVASAQVRAMIYLGINCGFGNGDCATLPQSKLDLAGGWHDYWRPKTQNPRRCPLWPETVKAIKAAIAARPDPKTPDLADFVFVTREGNCWAKDDGWNAISTEFRKLLFATGLYRPGMGFYSLRRTFETVATDAGHQPAVDYIMGHCPPANDMPAVYRQRISDDALRSVTDYVRKWFRTS